MTEIRPDGARPPELTVHAVGDIDLSTAKSLHERLARAVSEVADGGLVVADLAGVTFCDSQGIRTFVLAHNAAYAAGRRFVVRSVPEPIRQLLQIAGVLDLFTAADA